MTMTILSNTYTSLELGDCVYDDDTLTLAGADTILKGTILARDSVSGKYVLFAAGGSTNENGIPKAVMSQDVTVTGAGDTPIRPIIAGMLNRSAVLIDAGGTVTKAIQDALRSYGILTQAVQSLSVADNS